MAGRALHRLNSKQIEALKRPGRHADGGGLYLVVDQSGGRRWVFLFRWRERGQNEGPGRLREMGLGPVRDVTLAQARRLAADARSSIQAGIDPIAGRRRVESDTPTFGALADEVISSLEAGWRNEKHRAQWRSTIDTYAGALRNTPVDEIAVDDVLACLKPIWTKLPETASRVRGRIEKVLDAAKAKGFRTGENPAAWKGNLSHLLPARQKLTRGHHAAMPYDKVPEFVSALRARTGVASAALEFTILTAARTGEVIGATWAEIDIDAKIWTVPAVRMKGGRDHRVPLTAAALAVLEAVEPLRTRAGQRSDKFIFPGHRRDQPLSNMSMSGVLRRMGIELTVHGFRSSFKDWASEATSYPNELSEAALAHITGDKVERAYRRGDALDRRREMMEAWAGYLASQPSAKVVPLKRPADR